MESSSDFRYTSDGNEGRQSVVDQSQDSKLDAGGENGSVQFEVNSDEQAKSNPVPIGAEQDSETEDKGQQAGSNEPEDDSSSDEEESTMPAKVSSTRSRLIVSSDDEGEMNSSFHSEDDSGRDQPRLGEENENDTTSARRGEKKLSNRIDAPLPPLENLESTSDSVLNKSEIRDLPSWAFLVVGDRNDPTTWDIPVRERSGCINRPLLSKARKELVSGKRNGKPLKFVLTQKQQERLQDVFKLAWPGAPLPQFHLSVCEDDEEDEDEATVLRGNGDEKIEIDPNDTWLTGTKTLREETKNVLSEVNAMTETGKEKEEKRRKEREERENARIEEQARMNSMAMTLAQKLRARRMGLNLDMQHQSPQRSKKPAGTPKRYKDQTVVLFDGNGESRLKQEKVRIDKPKRQSSNRKEKAGKNNRNKSYLERPLGHRVVLGPDQRSGVRHALLAEARIRLADRRAMQLGYKDAYDQIDQEEKLRRRLKREEQEELERSPFEEEEGDDGNEGDDEDEELALAKNLVKESSENSLSEPVESTMDLYDDEDDDFGHEPSHGGQVDDLDKVIEEQSGEFDVPLASQPQNQEQDKEQPVPMRTYGKRKTNETSIQSKEENPITNLLSSLKNSSRDNHKADDEPVVHETRHQYEGNPEDDEEQACDVETSPSLDLQHENENGKPPSNAAPRNENYRRILEAEERAAQRLKRSMGRDLLEAEASEEELEDGVDNYGKGVMLQRKAPGADDDEEEDIQLNEADLEGIVDTISDDEGNDQGDGGDFHREAMLEKEEKELQMLQKDVENHRLAARFRSLRRGGSRYNRALLEGDDSEGDETDEEEEQARQERYRVIDEMRRQAASAAAQNGADVGETLEEIDEEAAQQEEFMKLSKMFKTREKLKKIKAEAKMMRESSGGKQSSLLGQDPQARKILGRIRRSGTVDANGLQRQLSAQSSSSCLDTLSRSTSIKSISSKRCAATKRSSSFITAGSTSVSTATISSTSNKLTTLSKKFVFSIEERDPSNMCEAQDEGENSFATSNASLSSSKAVKRKRNPSPFHGSKATDSCAKKKRTGKLSRLFDIVM